MKSIENKTTDINYTDTPDSPVRKATYVDLIGIVLNAPKPPGFDYHHVEAWVAFDKIKKENPEVIEFEDAPFNYIKRLVATMNWTFLHGDTLKFRDDFASIK